MKSHKIEQILFCVLVIDFINSILEEAVAFKSKVLQIFYNFVKNLFLRVDAVACAFLISFV